MDFLAFSAFLDNAINLANSFLFSKKWHLFKGKEKKNSMI